MLRHAVARSSSLLTTHLPTAGPSRLPYLVPCTCSIDRSAPSSRKRRHHRAFATASALLQGDASLAHSTVSTNSLQSVTPAVLHHLNPAKPPPAVIVEATHTSPLLQQDSAAQSLAQMQKAASAEAPAAKPARRSFKAAKAAITLTPRAVEQISGLLDSPTPKLIRIGVKNKGCAGMQYHLEYVDKPGKFDEVVSQDGVKVLIDSKALFSIIDSEMDWKEDKISAQFVFKNPNIKEECGCGLSFMT